MSLTLSLPVTDAAAFMAYAAAMSVTPGPNNAMLATLGARHGLRGAAPAAAGVLAGMFGLLVLAGSGVGALLLAVPGLHAAMTALGAAYMGWLAWALWNADMAAGASERPAMGFWGALTFQAVNPKALLMALTAAGGFLLPTAGWQGSVGMALAFVCVGGPCILLWALAGDRLRSVLQDPRRARMFARTMAAVVALTAIALVVE